MTSTFLLSRLLAALTLSKPLFLTPQATTAAAATRALPSYLHHKHNTTQIQQTRPLSHTPHHLSSPFRLTTNNPNTYTPEDAEGEYYSPYKPKRQWPPDMSKLSPKHQFRLERKYRRRAALKYARPKWVKATKITQWVVIGFVLVYALLFMEWDERGSPFDEIRRTFFAGVKGAFSTPPPPRPVKRSEDESGAQ
ncbi:hypothetical protein CBS115989_7558 [Aspergillus niger]|uniref:Transmembrane protein n=1 Tax=Aspergillus niger ATCC 13496 TaxID=1353008 RepID=A0A370C3G7_ASPNG|nr:uncharacterized protein BO96DRAFT_409637 [Aspergillus niger CBS 101883]KAI2815610.1 hypothetical protein CBS115989_7558 [Aspergillus niger]RDH20172.1 hypothetical protein M747DRAFT_370413 [Aspergillus niger ATCC 13496]KAI2839523.1 hypothetical protein CBS11232_9368 [Aspergillus niger]KAI2873983.1 hypothetical protein CBS115988_6605 [Aspergillus niger]KAI2894774.1 hypothetical protein CBS11852_4768 [Aspergillus niger]